MNGDLAKSLCTIHLSRPAVARCPSCRRFFCAECVTEHTGKFVCAACLAETTARTRETRKRRRNFHPAALVQFVLAFAICWVILYFFARFLGDIPDSFHDGTIWE